MNDISAPGAAYVLGDWGTSRLRLFRLNAQGAVTARLDGPGAGSMDPAGARRALADLLAQWQTKGPLADVLLCGMAGTPRALVAAGYAPCPIDLDGWLASRTTINVNDVPISVLPGLSWISDAGVPEVMRGEETQVFGAIALDPALASGTHTIVLPGTHSKWVDLVDGTIRGYRTQPTGELFALLTGQSTLMGDDQPGEGSFDDGFARGLARSGEPLASALFETRAARMLNARSREWSRGYLSALLIGGEMQARPQSASDSGAIVVIGDPALSALYQTVLTHSGHAVQIVDGDDAVLAGLKLAHARSPEATTAEADAASTGVIS